MLEQHFKTGGGLYADAYLACTELFRTISDWCCLTVSDGSGTCGKDWNLWHVVPAGRG
jgi:hypothetical protein